MNHFRHLIDVTLVWKLTWSLPSTWQNYSAVYCHAVFPKWLTSDMCTKYMVARNLNMTSCIWFTWLNWVTLDSRVVRNCIVVLYFSHWRLLITLGDCVTGAWNTPRQRTWTCSSIWCRVASTNERRAWLCGVPWRNCRYCLPARSVQTLQCACCVAYHGENAGTIYLSEACRCCSVHGIDSLRGLSCQSHKQPQPLTVSQMTSQCHKWHHNVTNDITVSQVTPQYHRWHNFTDEITVSQMTSQCHKWHHSVTNDVTVTHMRTQCHK